MVVPYTTQHYRNRRRISILIGRELETTEDVHTHTDGSLVVCENRAYHMLLHQRTEALEACGHADWRKCQRCGEYDDPVNLEIYKSGSVLHEECRRQKRKVESESIFQPPSYFKSHHKYINGRRVY